MSIALGARPPRPVGHPPLTGKGLGDQRGHPGASSASASASASALPLPLLSLLRLLFREGAGGRGGGYHIRQTSSSPESPLAPRRHDAIPIVARGVACPPGNHPRHGQRFRPGLRRFARVAVHVHQAAARLPRQEAQIVGSIPLTQPSAEHCGKSSSSRRICCQSVGIVTPFSPGRTGTTRAPAAPGVAPRRRQDRTRAALPLAHRRPHRRAHRRFLLCHPCHPPTLSPSPSPQKERGARTSVRQMAALVAWSLPS